MKHSDEIIIRDLEVFCNHGVFEEENVLGQKFLVSATLHTNTANAGEEDDLLETIHYGQVCHVIKEFMQNHTFQLIEAAAEQLARHLLIETERLEAVTLEVKSHGPLSGFPWIMFP